MVSRVFSFQRKKSVPYRSVAWLLVFFHFFWAAPLQAAVFTGGEGDGYSTSEGYFQVPTKLVFSVQPKARIAGQIFSPAPVVEILDQRDGLVTDATDTVTLAILNNPSAATLSGTVSMAAVNGVADFSGMGLSIDKGGEFYTIQAAASGLTSANSDAFNLKEGDYLVKSELTYDASALTFKINSWLEQNGAILSLADSSTSDIKVTIYNLDGTILTTFSAADSIVQRSRVFKYYICVIC